MAKKALDTEYVRWELENDILFAYYKQGLRVTRPIAEKVVQSRVAFTEGQAYPNLIFNMGINAVDKEARDFFSSEAGTRGVKAGAFVTNSAFSNLLINFFLRITKPAIPARMFDKQEEALQWLQQFK